LIRKGFPDFAIYYCAGTVVRQGLGHQLYDPVPRFEVEKQFASAVPQFRGPLPYTHPPFETLFFLPFSYLTWSEAYIFWNLMNVVLLGAVVFLLRPHAPGLRGHSVVTWILTALAFFPVLYCLLQGQDAILLLFFYTLTFVCLKKNKFAAAGACLGLGLFKFHLVLPFLFLFLVQKGGTDQKRKLLYGLVPVALVLATASAAIAGPGSIWRYLRYVLYWEDVLAKTEIRVPAGMPNLRGLMYMFLPAGSYAVPLLLLLSFGFLAFAAWKIRSATTPNLFELKFSLALVVTALISYHVVSYDLSMLLVPIVLLLNYFVTENRFHKESGVLVGLAIAALFFSPVQLFLSLQYKRFGLMAFVLLLLMYGIVQELSSRSREVEAKG
jgi:hypothetical protein